MLLMPSPIVSWYSRDNTTQITKWDIGTVDAGSISADFGVLIWNNRGGTTDVSDMQDCTITTKDSLGGNSGELVVNKWIEVKVDTLNETTFTPIGGNTTHPIRTTGSTTNADGTFTPGVAPHISDTGSVDILGVKNDGTKTNAAGNFVEVTLHANVPSTASAGVVNFLTRVAYKYV